MLEAGALGLCVPAVLDPEQDHQRPGVAASAQLFPNLQSSSPTHPRSVPGKEEFPAARRELAGVFVIMALALAYPCLNPLVKLDVMQECLLLIKRRLSSLNLSRL